MLLNIIFSFNRAMQLDLHLKSSKRHIKMPHITVVIYHYTNSHMDGYEKLIANYKNDESIIFLERETRNIPRYYYLKYPEIAVGKVKDFIRKPQPSQKGKLPSDNFKKIVEQSILYSECDLVMFNTDDGIWTDDIYIDEEVQSMLVKNGRTASLRFFVGDNLKNFPSTIQKWGSKYYLWNYLEDGELTPWTYPFAVDATVYGAKGLLEILDNVYYTGPVDLESNVVHYCLRKGYLGIGLSEHKTKITGTVINKVSSAFANPAIDINVDYLNQKYLEGYTLEIELPEKTEIINMVPEKVFLVKGEQREMIYEINEEGKKINQHY